MIFKFKRFSIDQTHSPFKIGTDGVLAGTLCDIHNAKNILDIGTGTGLIALMLAQRCNAKIDAIEINEIAFLQAENNFNNSPWSNQISCYKTSLQSYQTDTKYDLIVSNPPYFQNALKALNKNKSIAKHADLLSPFEFIFFSKKLLSKNGKLCFIYPVNEGEEAILFAKKIGLFCSQKINIKPTPEKETKRLFITLQREEISTKQEELIIEQNGRHQYSKKYIELTKDFYLGF